ncbi:MAG: nucleotidyltransferase substrate binding protein [Bdellovibrionales bacterium]|nr:nucleotidyltransferase substrate binding protein [Bdellovibrionales bacterium]
MASIVHFQKAVQALENSLKAYKSESDTEKKKMIRDSVIQRFEFCVELSWKTAVKVLGLTTSAPKPAIRDMARAGLIANPDKWFQFIEARNKTSHAYDEKIAEEVYQVAESYLKEGQSLLMKLEEQ